MYNYSVTRMVVITVVQDQGAFHRQPRGGVTVVGVHRTATEKAEVLNTTQKVNISLDPPDNPIENDLFHRVCSTNTIITAKTNFKPSKCHNRVRGHSLEQDNVHLTSFLIVP